MTDTTTTTVATTSTGSSALTSTSTGKTIVDDTVVAKVVGIAARDVPGVHSLGNGAARAIGAIRGAIGQRDLSQGVKVEVGEKQVAADITIVAEYPVPLQQVAEDVRSAVSRALEEIVGMEVAEVNVTIQDVFIPGDDDEDEDKKEPRVA
ncbi:MULTISPECIES: Asp23/Gls24 family envelope stress response protein [unclassified Curtobacterium]|uniref:Asp23/Gls24 family envelope stress response protein n=1 Tax=unclassified Curtobacterium TaxID=257496 RepID=UPI000D9E27CF|nr:MULTISPECIES: Asp23/Gls24 family envelope stress response protein [unclassified Curtobacterium]PYY37530.1 Asp23/Gls24 family envelope stress response protein [Curtobacterium sp. MCPF17_046]PYY49656.1 Asp23/Gls24 family envelope stress response protein [Curtobacterium sp. MCBD17_023]WIB16193.1 Asp23/Gls24 family envelope stress response protein [Curtobacterium sp. MCPF17_050]